MSVLEWKKFNLFSLEPCSDFNKFLNFKAEISAHCHNSSQKVFCDKLGYVHVFSRNSDPVTFQAHSSTIQLCTTTSENNMLLTLAQDGNDGIILQIFNLSNITKRKGAPCIGTARLSTFSKATVLRASLLDVQICVAIGFERGDLLFCRAAVNRDMSSNFHCFGVSKRTITGIEFIRKNLLSLNMFVSSHGGVFCFKISDTNEVIETKIVLDATNVPARCSALNTGGSGEPYFMVGCDDAVYCFTSDGRGPCYAIDGKKNCIAWFENNLVVVVDQYQKTSLSPLTSSLLIIIDIYNKMIVLSKLVDTISSVLVEKNNCYILKKSNELFVLRERDMQNKLRLLLAKNLYEIALRLVVTEFKDCAAGEINMQYGDYLLTKGDLNGAVNKYIKTVGLVEPYYVIRKLLDSRYNEYLAQYLNALVQTEFATEEHVKLLINCKERIALPSKVEHTCLNIYREHGLATFNITEAVTSSEKSQITHDINIYAFLNLMNDHHKVIRFFSRYDEVQIYKFFMENGQWFMKNHPLEVTNAIKIVCSKDTVISFPERFIPILLAHSDYCMDFLEHVTNCDMKLSQVTYNYLFELYLREWTRKKYSEEALIEFLKRYNEHVCVEHVFILCRNYSFWSGVIYIYKNCMQHLCVRQFDKSCDFQNTAENFRYLNAQTGMPSLRNIELMPKNSIKLIKNLLRTMLEGKHKSFLQILQSFLGNKTLLVQHSKDFFTPEHLQEVIGSTQQNLFVSNFKEKITEYNAFISNFAFNPIEFRNSVCDICRQQLKLPAVYYLCQHSFHKECLSAYSKNDACIACISNKKRTFISKHQAGDFDFCENVSDINSYNDIMEAISMSIGHGVYNQIFMDCMNFTTDTLITEKVKLLSIQSDSTIKTEWPSRLVQKISINSNTSKQVRSTNPFESESEIYTNKNPFEDYDANLNPFDE